MKIRDLFAAEDRSAIEAYCRKHTQQAYLGDHTALCRVLGQFLMYVDTRDLSLAPHLLMNGYWEMWVTQAIVDYVKPGMRCIDVGANFGYFTLLLAELVGEKGEVVGYEPQRAVRELLQASLVVSGMPWATSVGYACSDETKVVKLRRFANLFGSACLIHEPVACDENGVPLPGEHEVVAAHRLDEDYLRSVDFVKIDVQGHEMQVLAGMREMIARSPKIAIAMEFTPSEHEHPRFALETIREMGLTIKTIGTDGQVRPITLDDAAKADTGDHRMLWLSKG